MMNMILLAASSGLGTYTPAVQLYHYLASEGHAVSLEVLERVFLDEKLDQIVRARHRFQQDFRFALTARKVLNLHSPADDVCPDKSAILMREWREVGEKYFVVFSGFWLPLLKQYRELMSSEIAVDCVQMEVVVSPSWCAHLADYPYSTRQIWFYSESQRKIAQTLLPKEAVACQRERRLVLHGGGWQIGNYGDSMEALVDAGYSLLVGWPEGRPCWPHSKVLYFRVDPRWETWMAEEGEYPPVEVSENGRFLPLDTSGFHWLLQQIAGSSGIVSKPGGATLLDSLTTATPLIHASAYGETEARNASLWCSLGLGVSLAEWQANGCDEKILAGARQRLEEVRAPLQSYAETIHAA
jgi:hypothetical protein